MAAGSALVVVGFAYGAVSLLQAITGRFRGLRKHHGAPSLEQVRAGGWVGVGVALMIVLVGASLAVGGETAGILGIGAYSVIALGAVWGVLHRLERRRQASRRGP